MTPLSHRTMLASATLVGLAAGPLAAQIAIYTVDGIHPLDTGYARMAPIAARAIATALARKD